MATFSNNTFSNSNTPDNQEAASQLSSTAYNMGIEIMELGNNIAAETERAKAAEELLQENIDTEETERKQADADLATSMLILHEETLAQVQDYYPKGTIIRWARGVALPSEDWKRCDGTVVNGFTLPIEDGSIIKVV